MRFGFIRAYRRHGEDKLVECSLRPPKASLEPVAGRDLLILVFKRVHLMGFGPRGVHEIGDPRLSFRWPRRLSYAPGEMTTRAFPDLLGFRGGAARRTHKANMFLWVWAGQACGGRHLGDRDNEPRRQQL